MEIRRLIEQDFDASSALSEYAFLYTLSEKEKEKYRARFKDEIVWGVFEEEELCAKLTLIPLEVYLHGQVIKMGGVAGVSTWPEKRRQGMVSQLLRQALEEMKREGQLLSYLLPFSVAFYRKYGWELFTDHKNYTIPMEKMPTRQTVPGRVVREVRDIETFQAVYDRISPRYNGPLVRDRKWWERRVMNNVPYTAVYYNEANQPEAYVLYTIEDNKWITKEILWINETARQGLWNFIVNHDSRIKEVHFKLPVDDTLAMLLPDPTVKQEIKPFFMARIVDVSEFMRTFPFTATGSPSQFILQLEDRDAPWNDGAWLWDISASGEGQLTPQSADALIEASEKLPLIRTTIGILTTILLSYQRPSTLQRIFLLATDESTATRLDTLIPTRTTYLADSF